MQGLRNKALQLLAMRDHSQLELQKKLVLKTQARPEEIATLIQQFVEADWLNDERFAESYIRMRAGRGYGPLRIREDLRNRGVDSAIIEQQLAEVADTWQERIAGVWQKRFKGKWPKDLAERAKQMRFIQYRGFEAEHIKALFASR